MIEEIKTYIGTSIGAIICYLLILGYDPLEIVVNLFIHKILDKIQNFDIISLANGEGALSFLPIQDQLEKMTINKVGSFHTLKSLKEKFNKELICVTYNYTKKKIEYLNFQNYPDLPCITALRMSSNLPFIFESFKYMDDYYLDGGLVNNFPVNYDLITKENKVLGIYISAKHESVDTKNNLHSTIQYLYSIIMVPIEQISKNNINQASETCKIIEIQTDNVNILNFNLNTSDKLNLFSNGYSAAKKYFE